MRFFPAMLGLALIPLTFFTLLALRMSLASALLGALLITFDNALIAQSRLILLDSYLVFFTALTIYFWVRFANLDAEGRAFTRAWWQYLLLTGTALGAAFSCKWVGLFTIATIGLGTLRQLWLLLGNLKVTPRMWIKHFAARTLGLIITPTLFYMAMFQIHFMILNRSGDGDGFMSSEFQHTLIGHGMADTYAGELCQWPLGLAHGRRRVWISRHHPTRPHPRRLPSLSPFALPWRISASVKRILEGSQLIGRTTDHLVPPPG